MVDSKQPDERPVNGRRRVFVLGSVATFLSGIVGYLYMRPLEPAVPEPPADPKTRLERELVQRLDYLKIDPEGLELFMNAYMVYYEKDAPKNLGEDIVSRFLLSTDFFENGGDERRTLRFVAFFEPYMTPCYQPFAQG